MVFLFYWLVMSCDVLFQRGSAFGPDMSLNAMQKKIWGDGYCIGHEEGVGHAIYKGVAENADLFKGLVDRKEIGTAEDGVTIEHMDDECVLVSKEIEGVRHFLEYKVSVQFVGSRRLKRENLTLVRAGGYERLGDGSTLIVSYPFNTGLVDEGECPRVTEMYFFDKAAGICQKFETNVYNKSVNQRYGENAKIVGLENPGNDASLLQILHANETLTVTFRDSQNNNGIIRNKVDFQVTDSDGRTKIEQVTVNELTDEDTNQVGVSLFRGNKCKVFVPVSVVFYNGSVQRRIMMQLDLNDSHLLGFNNLHGTDSNIGNVVPAFRNSDGDLNSWLPDIRIGISGASMSCYYSLDLIPVDWVKIGTDHHMNIEKVIEVYRAWWEYLKSQQK